jgi:hypothetical protein
MMETVAVCETLGLYTFLDFGESKNLRNTGNAHQYLVLLTMTSFQNAGCPFHLDSLPEKISLNLLAVKSSHFILLETAGLLKSHKNKETLKYRIMTLESGSFEPEVPYLPAHRLLQIDLECIRTEHTVIWHTEWQIS